MKRATPTITRCSDFDKRKVTMNKQVKGNSIPVKYAGKQLMLNSGILECPLGVEHINGKGYGIINIYLSEDDPIFNVLESLDNIARLIGQRRSAELFGTELELDKVPYYKLLSDKETGNHCFRVFIEYKDDIPSTTVFDRDNDRLEDPKTEMSNRFTALYLIVFRGLSLHDGYLRWDYNVLQIKISESSRLPPGCLITDEEEEVERVLAVRRANDTYMPTFDVVDEGEEIANELLN